MRPAGRTRTRSGGARGARNRTLLLGDRLKHEKAPAERPEFRFSVPVLRVKDIQATVAWYREHLGFTASPFPGRAPHDFAIIGRDGVKLLVRRSEEHDSRASRVHSGWDLYIWVAGADFDQLEADAQREGAIVRPRRTMGDAIAEIEVRDPDGYVICMGGPIRGTTLPA